MPTDLPNVVRVAVEGTFDSERFVNVMHFFTRDGSPWSTSDMTLLATALDAALANDNSLAHLFQPFSDGVLIDTLTITNLDAQTPAQVIASVSVAGTRAAQDMPPMLAAVVKWGTAVANRKYRGRSFLTGLTDTMVSAANSDRIDTTILGEIALNAGEFVDAWAGHSSFGFCVFSRTDWQDPLITEPFQEILTASVNPLIAIQTRRRERAA